jgi:phenylacetate-CoA ligase
MAIPPLAERAYAASPVWMQHVFVSAYGARLRRLRYGPAQKQILSRIREAQWIPVPEQSRRQLATLNRVLAAARAAVPFYADRIPAEPLPNIEALSVLSMLTKADVLAAGKAMVSRDVHESDLLSVNTGGTTGTPLAVYCDRAALRRNYAFFARFLESAGVPPRARVATFAGRVLVPNGQTGGPYWRYNLAGRAMLCSSYHIGPATVSEYADALARYRPHLIDSYPSSLTLIARHLLRTRDTRITPRAVVTSSETLTPEVARTIEDAFGCPVFDHYGAAEMAALITQCREGVYHANADYGVVELLDGDRPVAPGEEGDIVATGFINPVMPFIRYRTGDRAVRGTDRTCNCGSPFPRIERILGRADDVLVTPEGHHVGRLDPIFKAIASLDETRIVQDEPDHVRVEIVSANGVSDHEIQTLREGLRNRLGPTMRIEFMRVPQLERTAGGKLRSVLNLTGARSEGRQTTHSGSPATLG